MNLLFDPDCILHSYVLEFDDFLAPLVIVDRFPRLIDLILADVHPHDAVKVIGEGEGAQSGAATDVDGQRFLRWRPKQEHLQSSHLKVPIWPQDQILVYTRLRVYLG